MATALRHQHCALPLPITPRPSSLPSSTAGCVCTTLMQTATLCNRSGAAGSYRTSTLTTASSFPTTNPPEWSADDSMVALPFLISDHQRAHRQEHFCDVVVYVFKLADYSRRKVAEIVTNEDVLWRARARPGLSRPVQFAPRSNFLAVTAPGRQQYHFCIALFEPRGWVQTASIDIENTTGQVRHRTQKCPCWSVQL